MDIFLIRSSEFSLLLKEDSSDVVIYDIKFSGYAF